jgi:hypothetical protein
MEQLSLVRVTISYTSIVDADVEDIWKIVKLWCPSMWLHSIENSQISFQLLVPLPIHPDSLCQKGASHVAGTAPVRMIPLSQTTACVSVSGKGMGGEHGRRRFFSLVQGKMVDVCS